MRIGRETRTTEQKETGDENMTEEKIETIPATEESLMIENDVHPFDEDLPKTVNFDEQMHPVLVDGIKGKACTCSKEAASTRWQNDWFRTVHSHV